MPDLVRAAALALVPLLLTCQPQRAWFMLAGQSNAIGRSTQQTPVVRDGVAHRAASADPTTGWGTHMAIEDPYLFVPWDTSPRGSPWPMMAQTLPGAEATIGVARGANCLLDWSAYLPPERIDSSNGAWGPGGSAYLNAIDAWEWRGRPPLEAFLYHQGECDAGVSWEITILWAGGTVQDHYDFIYPLYKAALMDLADRVAEDFGTVLIAAPISTLRCDWEDGQSEPGWPEIPCSTLRPHRSKFLPVHDAIIDAAAEHPNIVEGPMVDDLRSNENDKIHVYDVNELGRRWAAVVGGLR